MRRRLADLHAVHKIIIFGWHQGRNHALAEVFNLKRKPPSPPVEDGTVYLPGQCHRQLPEQVAFRVNPCAFGGQGQGDQLLVGKFGDTDLVEEIVLGLGQEFCYNLHISCSYHLFFGEN